ncbi:uncharacterized protein METZ01_LOCUS516563, partial [marine metagenome]
RIEVCGPDAAIFLHSQTTNDVQALDSGQGHASASLVPKAHLVATYSLHRLEDRYVLLGDSCRRQALGEHLEKYHVSEDLQIADHTEESAFLLVQGPRSGSLLQRLWPEEELPSQEHAIRPFGPGGEDALIVRRSETGESGFLLVGTPEGIQEIQGRIREAGPDFDHVEISAEVFEILRLEAGVPRWGEDMDETQILPETGLEQQAVSYQKGCYLGQEVVARVKTYGAV